MVKTLETMDREALRALPAVQSKQREAEAGLARYRAKLKAKFGDLPRLATPAQLQCGRGGIRAVGIFAVGIIHERRSPAPRQTRHAVFPAEKRTVDSLTVGYKPLLLALANSEC